MLGVEAAFVEPGAELGSHGLAGGAPGIDPEGGVGGIDEVLGGHELLLGLVNGAGGVTVEGLGEGALVWGGVALARLPGGGGAEEDTEPILVEEALAVVVPDGEEFA